MKNILFVLCLIIIFLTGCNELFTPSARNQAEIAQKEMSAISIQSVSIPTVSYFQERRTIAKWAKSWDIPNLPTYVYLVSFGKVLGYYVADGKPASTRSYIMPEENVLDDPNGGYDAGSVLVSAPDIDGTYGENNPGIRFFTAEGIAVEWAGDGASYLYSNAPINFGVDIPKLNPVKK